MLQFKNHCFSEISLIHPKQVVVSKPDPSVLCSPFVLFVRLGLGVWMFNNLEESFLHSSLTL